ncbi:MAG: thermonuclease family protein [Terriglobia bacterium]
MPRRRRLALGWLLLVLALGFLLGRVFQPSGSFRPAPTPSDAWRGVEWVVDGDTLVLDGGERVRLIGVDTPELGSSPRARLPGQPDPFAEEATAFVRTQVAGKRVRLAYGQDPTDDYGRTLAYVYLEDGTFLNAELIRQGYGRAFTRFPFAYREEFRGLEAEARENRRGLWAR